MDWVLLIVHAWLLVPIEGKTELHVCFSGFRCSIVQCQRPNLWTHTGITDPQASGSPILKWHLLKTLPGFLWFVFCSSMVPDCGLCRWQCHIFQCQSIEHSSIKNIFYISLPSSFSRSPSLFLSPLFPPLPFPSCCSSFLLPGPSRARRVLHHEALPLVSYTLNNLLKCIIFYSWTGFK